jgi:amino acid permease
MRRNYFNSTGGWYCLTVINIKVASNTGLVLLARSAASMHSRKVSFYAIAMDEPSWPAAAVAMDLAVAIKCWGVSISYLIVIGDLGSSMVSSTACSNHGPCSPVFWITLSLIFIAPVTFMKRLDSLKCLYHLLKLTI